MEIITVCNQKGGTAKTSTALSLGAGLVISGKRVLLIDMDSQRDLSKSLGIIDKDLEYTSDYIVNGKSIKKTIMKLENGIHIVPGSYKLTGSQIGLTKVDILKRAVWDINYFYDYLIIDTAPSLSILSVNAILVCNTIIICFVPEYLPFTGIKDLNDTINMLKDKYNINPRIKILITMYDQRKLLHKKAVESIRKHFKKDVFNTMIRTCVSIAEAPGYFKTIYDYSPDSHASQDYKALTKEILKLKEKK